MTRATDWDIGTFSGTVAIGVERNPSACPAWAVFAGAYDQFEVHAMSVTIGFPCFAEVPPTAVGVPRACVFCYDNDAAAAVSTFSGALERSSASVMEAHGLQKVSYRLPKGIAAISGANIGTTWCDCLTPVALMGVVSMVLTERSTSGSAQLMAKVIIEYDVSFRYRQ